MAQLPAEGCSGRLGVGTPVLGAGPGAGVRALLLANSILLETLLCSDSSLLSFQKAGDCSSRQESLKAPEKIPHITCS